MRNKILTAAAALAVMAASACSGGYKPSTTTSGAGAGVDATSVGTATGIGGSVYGGDSATVSLSADKIKACQAIFSRSVPAARDKVLIDADASASVANQPFPPALANDLVHASNDDGSLTIVAVNGSGVAPTIVAKDVALSTPGERDRPSVGELAAVIPACVKAVYLSRIKSVGTGTDLYRAISLSDEMTSKRTHFWSISDLLSNRGQLNLTKALLAMAPAQAAAAAAHAAPIDLHGALWNVAGLGDTVDPLLPQNRQWIKTFAQTLCQLWHGSGCAQIALDQVNPVRSGARALPSDPPVAFPGLTRNGCTFTLDGIAFAGNDTTLNPAATRLLLGAPLTVLRKNPQSTATFYGYASRVTATSNQHSLVAFSKRRAESAAHAIETGGVSAKRLTVVGRGDTDPVWVDIDRKTGRQIESAAAKQRRVDIVIRGATSCAP